MLHDSLRYVIHFFRRRSLRHQLKQMESHLDARIQQTIDEVAELRDVVTSTNQGMDALEELNAQQATKITDLQAQIAAGTGVTEEDLVKLGQSNTDFAAAITALRANIPSNTGPTPPPPFEPSGN